MFDEIEQLWCDTEELLTHVCAAFDDILLVFSVDNFAEPLDEQAAGIRFEERVPLAAPNDFDDVPTRATERGLEFLNDLAVATHRTVEPLQVAVHDECEIVESLAGGERDRAE